MLKRLVNTNYLDLVLKDKIIVFIGLLIVAMIYYGNSLNNGFSLDDSFIFTENKLANNGLKDVKAIFLKNSFDYGSYSFGYRPVALLSFAIESQFFGINPKASHMINLLLYVFSCFLIFVLTGKLIKGNLKIPLLIACFFLIMPIHSEIVNNIKCRDELLMFLFGLAAAIFWIKSKNHFIYGIVSLVFLVLSILSKKSGFIFLGVMPLLSYYTNNGSWKKLSLNAILMAIPFFAYRILNKKIKLDKSDRDYSFAENPLFDTDIMDVDKFVMATESTWFYLKSLAFPTKFISYYGYQSIPFEEYSFYGVFAALLFFSLLILGIYGFIKQKTYAFGIAILLGGLIPFINLFKPMVGIVAERFLTISSLGFAIAITLGLDEILKQKKHRSLVLIGIIVYALAYLPIINNRNSEWQNMYSLVSSDVKKLPNSLILNYMHGNTILTYEVANEQNINRKKILIKDAYASYNKAHSILPTKDVLNERGTLFYKVFKENDKAIADYKEAIIIDPNYQAAIKNLGKVYFELGNKTESILCFQRLIALNKEQDVYKELIRQLLEVNRFKDAQRYNDTLLQTFPQSPDYLLNQANILFMNHDLNGSLIFFKKYLKINPNSPQVRQRIKSIESIINKKAAQ